MKNIIYFMALFCLGLIIINCNDELDSWATKSETIPLPDTNTVAFMSENGTLCISNNNYSKSYHITFHPAYAPNWSPDKQWLCFDHDFKIWKIKYDGANRTQLTPASMTCGLPRFSPDGSRIVLVAGRYPKRFITDIYIMNSNGSRLERITDSSLISPEHEYIFAWPDWMRNGKQIIFEYAQVKDDPRLMQSHLAIYDLETRDLTTLSSLDSLQPFQPHPSPARDEFLFVSLVSREYGGTDIYRANLDGTDVTRLTQEGRSWLPDWSFDGNKIIYEYLNDDMILTIRIMNRDGTNDHQLKIAGQEFGAMPNW